MGRARHRLTIRVPIPSQLPAEAVIESLQSHSPLIRHQALVTRFQRRPVALSSVVDDSFFLSSGKLLSQYDVYEKITLVPGVAKKEISFPVIFQSVRGGVRSRADAPGGVRLWAEYRVERRKAGFDERGERPMVGELMSTNGYEGFANGGEVYDLVEDVLVEANSMLMPFISRQMEGAHRDLCQKVVHEVGEKLTRRPSSSPWP
jgi:hypothetical protein